MSVPIIKDILRAYRIPILQVDGYEADDVIGTLATKAGEAGVDTYMLTPDKDYGQLVKKNVFIFRPRHGGGYETMSPETVLEKYSISSTSQVIDLLALMGDSADNFPGCPGVGEKTAAKLSGEGEAEYMKTLSEAYNTPEKAEFYNFMRSLDAFKESLGKGEKTIILDQNSELARMFYMNN